MNKRQKLVQAQFLGNEEAVIERLDRAYKASLATIERRAKELQDQINALQGAFQAAEDAAQKAQLQSMIQSKVYQKQYQDALKKQINSILDNLQVEEFKTVSEYLQKCYEDGFIGTMFDLQGQGIPLCFPLDQEAMVRAVQLDSKISKGLYSRLGEDIALLKQKISAQVSRGIATGMSWQQVAQQLSAHTNIGYNNAVRIARTEGHRIQVQAGMDACHKAQERGADIVKQWDGALDNRTRPSHRKVDGEIRELDEPFSNGLMFPGDPSGGAAEVVNCRCALLQRAKWALDEDELDELKERAEFFGLDKADTFDEYKEKYLKAAEAEAKKPHGKFASVRLTGIDREYAAEIEEVLNGLMDDYPVDGLKIKTNSARGEFGHFQGGIKGVTRKGKYCAESCNEIAINKILQQNKHNSYNSHLRNYESRGSLIAKAARPDLATVPHEYGHAIDYLYTLHSDPDLLAFAERYKTAVQIGMKDVNAINDFNAKVAAGHHLSKEIFDELAKEYGLSNADMTKRILDEYGSYAASSKSEFLAEAFANMRVLDDSQKTDFMKSFEAIFNRKFKERFGG